LRSPKGFADNDRAFGINAVNLKDALRKIETDRSNLHDGWLLSFVVLLMTTYWHIDVSTRHPQDGRVFSFPPQASGFRPSLFREGDPPCCHLA